MQLTVDFEDADQIAAIAHLSQTWCWHAITMTSE